MSIELLFKFFILVFQDIFFTFLIFFPLMCKNIIGSLFMICASLTYGTSIT